MSTTIALHTITKLDAQAVLYVTAQGQEGWSVPAEVRIKVVELALMCDDYSRERLARGFEGPVSAVRAYRELGSDGIKILQDLAREPQPF